ncbi:2-oxoglutarate ferredoxin oxidoreductase subunit delta [Nocardioides soli]|uniref:2-oxoglutarate ferredoxin oxidoreductase subunit delta n=2 Tax=Nocardioidaceae TaxID=85015 RepID=A0A7W4VXT5_9ACTN|nr:2-oxoglutarate ferredoxin oxidoreductase subunit delta [Nocardioides soli]
MTMATIRSTGTVVIDVDACKGCDLCVAACPVDVLVMTTDEVNVRGYPYPQLLPGCVGCKACSQICPDFVFQVYRFETPVEHEVSDPPPESSLESSEGVQ